MKSVKAEGAVRQAGEAAHTLPRLREQKAASLVGLAVQSVQKAIAEFITNAMNEVIQFVDSIHNSRQFSTSQLRTLDKLARQAGEMGVRELADTFAAACPDVAAIIDFVQSATAEGYDIRGELGEGGMSVLFRVFDRESNREEALEGRSGPARLPTPAMKQLLVSVAKSATYER